MIDRRTSASHVFVDTIDGAGPVPLGPDAEHHLIRVLRLRDGEVVSVSDGAGRWRPAAVARVGESVRLDPCGDVVSEARRHPPLTLATAIPKGDRLDWLVQKATELGVDRLQLLHAERSVVRWKPDRVDGRLERLRRISDEAARQSRRVWRVEIAAPVPASTVLSGAVAAEPGGRRLAPGDATIAVGPEGGWTRAELDLAADLVDLGPNILRTETAGLAVITLSVASRHRMLGLREEME